MMGLPLFTGALAILLFALMGGVAFFAATLFGVGMLMVAAAVGYQLTSE